jgi:antitoxin HicB
VALIEPAMTVRWSMSLQGMIPDVPYRFTIQPLAEDEGGGDLIAFPDLPGCISDGETIEAAITNAIDAMRGWIAAMRAEGHPMPAPLRGA